MLTLTHVDPGAWSWGHARAFLVTLVLVGGSMSAFVRDPSTQDSFPFSTFPMFATVRTTPRLAHLSATRADGTRYRVPPRMLGTDEIMQAHGTIRAASGNKRRARELCEQVASTLLRSGPSDLAQLELLVSRYDPIAYFTDPGTVERPLERRVVARCAIRPEVAPPSRGPRLRRGGEQPAKKPPTFAQPAKNEADDIGAAE